MLPTMGSFLYIGRISFQEENELKTILSWLLLLSVAVVFAGCSGDDESPTDPGDTHQCHFPDTPDLLMTDFKVILENMLLEDLDCIVHEDFRLIISQSTLDEWAGGSRPIALGYFDRDTILTIHENLFGGETGIGPGGEIIPPVASINVTALDKDGTWVVVDPSTEYFGGFTNVYKARFNVLLHFNNPDQHRYEVDQTMEFFAIQEGEDWKLLGILPFEGYKSSAVDNTSYDDVLSFYR